MDERMKEKERSTKSFKFKVIDFQNAWRNVIPGNAIENKQQTEKWIYSAIENNQWKDEFILDKIQ